MPPTKQYIIDPKECLNYIHDFEILYQELLHCKSFKYDNVPKNQFNWGAVYIFCEKSKIIYVGYSSRTLEASIHKQFNENRSSLLAWRLFFDRNRELLIDYSHRDLIPKKIASVPEFHKKVEKIKEEIKSYDLKAVNLRQHYNMNFDMTKEALFEIYVNLMSKSKYNDFE